MMVNGYTHTVQNLFDRKAVRLNNLTTKKLIYSKLTSFEQQKTHIKHLHYLVVVLILFWSTIFGGTQEELYLEKRCIFNRKDQVSSGGASEASRAVNSLPTTEFSTYRLLQHTYTTSRREEFFPSV